VCGAGVLCLNRLPLPDQEKQKVKGIQIRRNPFTLGRGAQGITGVFPLDFDYNISISIDIHG